jgi:pyruvate/2-oxoglutarate/acetoin dehydrogenase E1 component
VARILSYLEAIGEALSQELDRDPSVFLLGEDNVGGTGCDGKLGNAWGPTKGLHERFPDRILDTPITEAAFVGAAVGAAATGMRPVVDLLFIDFMGVCFDQLLNQAAKLRYMAGGKASVPLVVRAMWGAGMRRGAQHSQALYPVFAHIPGLKVVVPAFPEDAKGLMAAAIRDDDPVIFFEHKMLYFSRGPVPEESYEIPLGTARVVRPGSDCTIVAVGRMVHEALAAAQLLSESGTAECEVIDPRTISPLDTDTICDSVRRTGRLIVVDEANRRCGFASDVASVVAESAFEQLRGPIRILTPPHTPTPFSPVLEDAYSPTRTQIADAVLGGVQERAIA